MADTHRLRASDADREAAVERLRAHHTDGRLAPEEFRVRMEAAYDATYVDELAPLFVDLPPAAPAASGGGHQEQRSWRLRAPLLIALVVGLITTIGAVTNGHPPFGLLWVALAVFWWRGHWFGVSRRPLSRRGPASGSRPTR